jgi:hypothetical protein
MFFFSDLKLFSLGTAAACLSVEQLRYFFWLPRGESVFILLRDKTWFESALFGFGDLAIRFALLC